MSRAFVKEPDGDQVDDDVVERPQSEYPNYMTTAGLERMRRKLDAMRDEHRELKSRQDELAAKNLLKRLEADLRYLEKRIQCAIPVAVAAQPTEDIRFGATAQLLDENDHQHEFTIVGEDEADVEQGMISWISPLARALIGRQAGDTVIWNKPSGDQELEIVSFSYRE